MKLHALCLNILAGLNVYESLLKLTSSEVLLAAMADSVRELQVSTLEGGFLTVQVTPTTTIRELKRMLREKKHEDPIERKILKAEVLVRGALVHSESQTLAAAGLSDAEFEVTVVYSRKEVEAATKTAIYAEGFVQVNIPASLVQISARAFQDCTQVVRVVIPESVTAIGESAFAGSFLASITIPESVTAIGDDAFAGCSFLASITIPGSVTAIGQRAFEECNSLGSITIPESVTAIGEGAFQMCSSLVSITIPESVTAIRESAFENCTSVVSITIPVSVTAIEDFAFAGCCSLRSITIPDSVTAIGKRAFENCWALESITVPESVTIGEGAFAACRFTGFRLWGAR